MTDTIVLASGNTGKLLELRQILSPLGINALPQSDFKVPDVAETGLSFIENAIIKARNACLHAGLPAIADDSGLEVDALEGKPGIYSARFSGPGASDQSNNDKLLNLLEKTPDEARGARFRCVVVFMRHAHDPSPLIGQGSWEGNILREARGSSGFGYDPLFYVKAEQCSAAELSPETKNRISHRACAMTSLVEQLARLTSRTRPV